MQLVVYPEGGLCNRMRVVASAYSFTAGRSDVACRVVWSKDSGCGAWFDELFIPVTLPRFQVVRAKWWQRPGLLRWLNRLSPCRLVHCDFNKSGHDSLSDLCREHGRVRIATCYQVCGYAKADMRRLFRPRRDLQATIDALCAGFVRPVYGVHIRRTDHWQAIEHSPTAAFATLIESLRRENRARQVFLACDDDGLRRRLAEEHKGFVATNGQRDSGRDTLQGMRCAVADLFALAATERVYGTWGSSFSDTAAELGDAELFIVTADGARKATQGEACQ